MRAAFVVTGAAAGVGGTYAVTSGAHEAITFALGDSIQPRFFVRTDTVLKVVGNQIVAAKCGPSMIFLRTYHKGAQLTADSIAVNVPCAATPRDTTVVPLDTTTASVVACTIPPDSATKYHISGDTTGDPALVQQWCKPVDTIPLFAPIPPVMGRKA